MDVATDGPAPAPGTGVDGGPEHLVLYPTWTGLFAVALGPPILLATGLAAWSVNAGGWVAIALLALGTGAALIGGWGFPRRVVVGPQGIVRHCLLRRHQLPYDEVARIERAPGSQVAAARRLAARSGRQRTDDTTGGLVAAGRGRRRWMLTDQPEARAEFDHLAGLLAAFGSTMLRARRPGPDQPPTTLYRRRPAQPSG